MEQIGEASRTCHIADSEGKAPFGQVILELEDH